MKKFGLLLAAIFALSAPMLAHASEWDDLLTYFDAKDAHPTKDGYFSWNKCWDDKFDNHPIGPDNVPGLPKICQPDTLYTWEGPRTLEMLETEAGADKEWAKYFDKELFSHINPVATFGYGLMSFRYKLKPDTQFFLYTANTISTNGNALCKQLPLAQQEKTVVVRTFKDDTTTGVDYILCSPQVIESWSYDTKTHYDEIIASLKWNFEFAADKDNSCNWIPYTYTDGVPNFIDSNLDSHDWSKDHLIKNLTKMREKAESTGGTIIYAKGVPHVPTEHFKTARPVYWNTRSQ